jgi:hypothetical protein
MALACAAMAATAQVSQIGGTREARLSGSCHSVDDGETVSLSVGDVRVRRGGSVRITGVRQSVFVDAGGMADVQGSGGYIYVARGGRATVGGSRNQVVAEPGGSVILVGSAIMTVVDMIGVQVHQNGSVCR